MYVLLLSDNIFQSTFKLFYNEIYKYSKTCKQFPDNAVFTFDIFKTIDYDVSYLIPNLVEISVVSLQKIVADCFG